MNHNNKTIGGFAYLSPNITLQNSKDLATRKRLERNAQGTGQSVGGSTALKSSYFSSRLTNPLNYT